MMFSLRSRLVDNGMKDDSSSSSKTVTSSDCCDYERFEDENCSDEQQLYQHDHQQHQQLLIMPMFTKFKGCSLFLGLLVGFFIQFSTLGANFLLLTLWGQEVINTSKKEVIVFSLLWSFFTSFMAIVVLGFLRALVSMVFRGSNPNNKEDDDDKNDKHSSQTQEDQQEQHDNDESILEELVLHMECRFVVGALIGVCFAWTMTDVLLGMKAQIIYSIMTLIIALLWCKVMMWCFTRHDGDYVHIAVESCGDVEDEGVQDKDHQKTSSSLLLSV